MKKTSTILIATAVFLSSTLPVMTQGVSAEQVKVPTTVDAQKNLESKPSSDFINKFDQAVKLSGSQFIIDTDNLPKNTTAEELTQLREMVSQKNSIISDSRNLNNGTKIEYNNNSVTIIAASENNDLLRFREGSNYVHVYWWGLRIGISKSTLHYIGAGVTIGGIWVPEPVVSKVLSTLGVVATLAPGGIVFNSTPPIATFWGPEFQ
ncbi:hypothetical protein KNP65_03670 [Latilactobacillus curvatus]|uniref:hypothetical protein n=1 Tax=Latilactobacillus curvatus TaxID=28038 RepID=UPI0024119A0F|nr:hypothetical protein [Latilactobacillus curvatus]MDG2979036.1 hypothetical protein [Latilactobacillus curvatus]